MSGLSTEAILLRALAARMAGRLPDEFAKDIADLVTEVRRLRAVEPASDSQTEIHAVTGTHHKSDARVVNLGRRGGRRYVGFQLEEN